jgi:hypothetical protein
MTKAFEKRLAQLRGAAVGVVADNIPDERGTASVVLEFADGTLLNAAYWRLIQDGIAQLSSFDHQQKYGLPTPIDAKTRIITFLDGKLCREVIFDGETGDLILIFNESTKLQVLNFTGYEIWTIRFPDGTAEYSNYALLPSANDEELAVLWWENATSLASFKELGWRKVATGTWLYGQTVPMSVSIWASAYLTNSRSEEDDKLDQSKIDAAKAKADAKPWGPVKWD